MKISTLFNLSQIKVVKKTSLYMNNLNKHKAIMNNKKNNGNKYYKDKINGVNKRKIKFID